MFQLILVGITLLGVTQVQSGDHGAELVTSEQAPWVASIMIEEGAGWRHVCTGTLVKANKVVTAAGCFDKWPAKRYHVMLGCTDRSGSHGGRQDVDVYTVVKHPKYINNDDKINNLAVATLASSADLTGSHVAVLPIEPVSPVDGDECHIYAWPTPSETDTTMIPNLNFHKMSKVSGSRGAHSRRKRSTHKLNDSIKQRAHTRFTTHLTPHTPHTNNMGANMHNGSLLNVHRRRLRQLASNTDCHEKFQQFEGHTACLEKDANTVPVPFDGVMKELVVDLHNEYRAQVTPPATNMLQMSWDDELAMVAQRWADRCPDDHDDLNFIPGRFGVGQNLFWAWTYGGGDIEADLGWAIEEWFIEHHDYDYNKPHYDQTQDQNKPTGHYSQLAWASTYKVGCAVAWCDQTKTMYIVVCNYGPQGNMMDQEKPYETGAQRCSKCKTCVEGLCDCGGKECGFGSLNPATCECDDDNHDGEEDDDDDDDDEDDDDEEDDDDDVGDVMTRHPSAASPGDRTRVDFVKGRSDAVETQHLKRSKYIKQNDLTPSGVEDLIEEGRNQVLKIIEEGHKQVINISNVGERTSSMVGEEGGKQHSKLLSEGNQQYYNLTDEGEKQYLKLVGEGGKMYSMIVAEGQNQYLKLVDEGQKQNEELIREGSKQYWQLVAEGQKQYTLLVKEGHKQQMELWEEGKRQQKQVIEETTKQIARIVEERKKQHQLL